ncbi:cytochrome c-type biogenesis CcmF C-terminal domain-containing protein [Escherichia coli]
MTLAGYTFHFERLDLQAKGNYTSEKAIVALFDHQQRIGELMPERRFYEARRQQMMEPSIRWNGIDDWYAVMGEKPERIVTLFVCMYKAVCAGFWGEDC